MASRATRIKEIVRKLIRTQIAPGLDLSQEVEHLKQDVRHFEDDANVKGWLDAVVSELGVAQSPPPSWAQGQLRVVLNDKIEEVLLALIVTKRFSRAVAKKLKRRELGAEVSDSELEAVCREVLLLDSDGNPQNGDWDEWADRVIWVHAVQFDAVFGRYEHPEPSKTTDRTIQINLPAIALGARRCASTGAGVAAAVLLHELGHAGHDAVSWDMHGAGLEAHRVCLKEGVAELASNILADRVSVGVGLDEVRSARMALNTLKFPEGYTAWRLDGDADDCPLLQDIAFAKAVLCCLAEAAPQTSVGDALFTDCAAGFDAALLSDEFAAKVGQRSSSLRVEWNCILLAQLAKAGHALAVASILSDARDALSACSTAGHLARWVGELECASSGLSF